MPLPLLGAAGMALGAGGLAASLFGGGGDSGGSQRLGLANPAGMTLGDLFGTSFTRKGGFIRGGDPNSPFAAGRVKPLFEDLFYNPLVGNEEMAGVRGLFGGTTLPDIISRGMEGFRGLSDLSLLGAATGFETDATPIYNEAIRRFGADILPQIAETSGLGLQSSGFLNLAGRESANLLGQAALRGTELSEAAADRRLGLLPIAAQLQAAEAAFPLNITGELEARRMTPFNAFTTLAGIPTPIYQAGYPTQDSSSDLIGSLGGLAGVLGPLLKLIG